MLKLLRIYNADFSESIPLDVEYAITHTYDGYDQLEFEINVKHHAVSFIQYEAVIDERDNRYLIKSIEADTAKVKVGCAICLDDFKQTYYQSYRRTNITMRQALEEILPSTWTLVGDFPTFHTTIELSEGQPIENATPYMLLPYIANAFGRPFQFDAINKILCVIDVDNTPSLGGYITNELNLKSLVRSGSSSSFATRLYCFGKKDEQGEPITFSNINNGKNYLEDFSYSNKLIESVWSDERYTDPQSLLEAGKAKLQELAHPNESYSCELIDLQKANPKYSFLEIQIHRRMWLLDRDMHTCIEHRVVEYKEYRGRSASYLKNTVTLSTLKKRLETKVQGAIAAATQAVQKANAVSRDLAGLYTSSEVDALFRNERELTQSQLQTAIQLEKDRADEKYSVKPITGTVLLSTNTLSKTISVPYADFFVTLTPNAKGNCWANIQSKSLTITADTPMQVWYTITERSE